MIVIETNNETETYKIGYSLAKLFSIDNAMVYLEGDLGVGKTVFVRGMSRGFDIDEPITSPTFTIVNEYEGNKNFYHFDLYRLSDVDELYEIGFEEYIENGICIFEWPGILSEEKFEHVTVSIEKCLEKGIDYRSIKIDCGGVIDEDIVNRHIK